MKVRIDMSPHHSHGRCAWVLRLLPVVVCLGIVEAEAADKDWLLGTSSDEELLALVGELDALAAPAVAEQMPIVDAVCLVRERTLEFERNRHHITENAMYRVADAENSGLATRHFLFPARSRIEQAVAWVIRDGRVARCPREMITIIKGGAERPTEVILAIPDVRDGDVVGWSIRRGENRVHPGLTMALPEQFPVKLTRVRLLSDGYVAYRILGRNLVPGSFNVDVLERRNGTETNVLAEIRDITPMTDGPYAPPVWSVAPTIDITWRGLLDTSIGSWLFLASWSEAAVWFESQLADLTRGDKALAAKALELVAKGESPTERLHALHEFVQREIVAVSGDEMRAEDRPAHEVFASRTASPFEAGVLLHTMAQAAGLDVRAVFARSQDLGPIDNGNPSLQQFSDLIVEDLAAPGSYCVPGRPDCRPGTLPGDLLGATALVLAPDLEAKSRAVVEEVFSSVDTNVGRLIAVYQDRVSRLPWQTMFNLPGNAALLTGAVRETVTGKAGSDTLAIEVRISGRGYPEGEAALEDQQLRFHQYCTSAFPAAEPLGAMPGAGPEAMAGSLRCDLGEPAGDTWLVPGEAVFGAPFLADWDGPGAGLFHITATRTMTRAWRLLLPAGWRLAAVPPELVVNNPRFRARERVGVVDGALLVLREVEFRRGITPTSGLAELEAAVARVRDYELAPLLLVRTTAAASR